jgi:hypothetical protein
MSFIVGFTLHLPNRLFCHIIQSASSLTVPISDVPINRHRHRQESALFSRIGIGIGTQ